MKPLLILKINIGAAYGGEVPLQILKADESHYEK